MGFTSQASPPGAREAIAGAGAVDSFGEAASVVLKKLSGPRISESTAQRTSEATGRDIGRGVAAGETFGPNRSWSWHKDARGKSCAYVSLDLTGPGMQGPDGARADGRMAEAAAEDRLRANFGRVDAVILDFYHAAEHLGDLARALHPGDEETREGWIATWNHRPKHKGARRC